MGCAVQEVVTGRFLSRSQCGLDVTAYLVALEREGDNPTLGFVYWDVSQATIAAGANE